MSPSFNSGDLLFVNTLAYRRRVPQRGDIVIVQDPREHERHSLKRVIGLPCENVRLADGMLWIDNDPIREPYLKGRPSTLGLDESAWKLAPDEYFAMGDNRIPSTDSRSYGPVTIDAITGKVMARLWPIRRAGMIHHGG